eukprot:9127915-Heterocapsa_arctica.AAC.1
MTENAQERVTHASVFLEQSFVSLTWNFSSCSSESMLKWSGVEVKISISLATDSIVSARKSS